MSSRLAFPRVAPNSSEFEEPSFFVRQRPRKSALSQPPPKKRKLDTKIEEITYDGAKREDYLTGFHKRKVQRIKNAKEEDAKKAREERILMRKQLREERKQELTAHVEAVNSILAAQEADIPALVTKNGGLKRMSDGDSDDGWSGIEDDEPPLLVETPLDDTAEYIDDDKYTTVTIESVDVSRHGIDRVLAEGEETEEMKEAQRKKEAARLQAIEDAKKKKWPKKEKKKTFRYETKVERKFTQAKQKAKNRRAADARKG